MTAKEDLVEFLSDYFCHTGINLDNVANEIIELFLKSNTKEKLYKGIIKRELKDKYEESRYGTSCIKCGKIATIEDGILIQRHYRRCPIAQMERILAL